MPFCRLFTLLSGLLLSAAALAAPSINVQYAFAQIGEPKYAPGFNHFDYVNPAAPKGGSITLAAIGTYDNFNRYAMRGNPGVNTETLYDTLFTGSDDEPGSLYPLIAESARYPGDYRWVEVTINPRARFQDGSPVTAEDAAFTFHKLMTEGVPQFRMIYKGVTARAISRLTVRYDLPEGDRSMMLNLLQSTVMPKAFWQHHNLADPLASPPLSGGAYRISAWKLGQSITYSRVKDYWAADLPVNKGRNNFDTMRFEYYLDDDVAFEAFKAGAYDFRNEGSVKKWATQYQGRAFDRRQIVKYSPANNSATETNWLAFNISRPQFSDRRVRAAIAMAYDFEWMNKALFYNADARPSSYFQNTEYAARGYPDASELAILAPFRGQIPDEVFSQQFTLPRSNGSGYDRQNLLKAMALLKAAGWTLQKGKLVNTKTGQPLRFELLLKGGGEYPWVLPFQHNLARMGITMGVRQVDASQYLARLRKRDFDMLPSRYFAFPWPDSQLQIIWASAYIDSSYNRPGVKNPVVDALIKQIIAHQGDEAALLPLGRALDRVLLWNWYMIPTWYFASDHYAMWDKFSRPEVKPTYSLGFSTWWYDVNKAARLPAQRR